MPAQDFDIALYKELLTGNVSDAMEQLAMPRSVLVGYTLLGDPETVLVGRAYTVQQARKEPGTPRTEKKTRHDEVSGGLAQPGDVIVIDVGGETAICSWGENHCLRCRKRGIAGLMINGAVRDASAIRKTGFPVLCRGFSPVKSLWDLRTVSLNEPVRIDGVEIKPGDLIMGDETGIVVIPTGREREVYEVARDIRDKEEEYMASLLKDGA